MAINLLDALSSTIGTQLTGVGQDKPIAFNDMEEGWAKSRRAEIVVSKR
jgi:outer membrane protein OmpA-like peptidoglycan-associated protein